MERPGCLLRLARSGRNAGEQSRELGCVIDLETAGPMIEPRKLTNLGEDRGGLLVSVEVGRDWEKIFGGQHQRGIANGGVAIEVIEQPVIRVKKPSNRIAIGQHLAQDNTAV